MMVDPPDLTDQERMNITLMNMTLTALRQAAFDGQKTTLARIHYSHLARAADEIERLTAELANANRLLEIGRRRSLEKSGGLKIGNND
jgi:hypothetical protein